MDDIRPSGDLNRILMRRLDGDGPLGVAVSGGGDSVALLYRLAEWGRRPLHVFCVDHGLNPASPAWTRDVAVHARRTGAAFTALRWAGPKPATGLSAAARLARHRLLADAARAAGIRVLCLAHTQDDIREAAWMRAQGSNVTAPAEWSPSPVWPQGRGIFLLRPLLGEGRDSLRDDLTARKIAWIDDPANANPASLRARARSAGKTDIVPSEPTAIAPESFEALLDRQWAGLGLIALRHDVLAGLSLPMARKIVAAAVVCAGGGDRLPRGDSVEALLAEPVLARPRTLCGARIWSSAGRLLVVREAGDIGRQGHGDLQLAPGAEAVWDGRYALRAAAAAGRVAASSGVRSRLSEADAAALRRLPAAVRGILPVFDADFPDPVLSTPRLLGQTMETGVDCVDWVLPRLAAACGLVDRESRIGFGLARPEQACMAKPQTLPI